VNWDRHFREEVPGVPGTPYITIDCTWRILAQEIADDLQTALDQFAAIAEELKG